MKIPTVIGTIILAVELVLVGGLIKASAVPAPKVTICHNTGSQTNPTVTITVSENAVAAHVKNHGDTLGACPNNPTPPVDLPNDPLDPESPQTTVSNPGVAEETQFTGAGK